nr:MAG TPA: hypothetical protein [Bacteriophage sp.]
MLFIDSYIYIPDTHIAYQGVMTSNLCYSLHLR